MEDAIRYIQGPKTQLADPHGIYVDAGRNEQEEFVDNILLSPS